ncbi:MAG: cytochrome c [Pseudomonadota bacterium]|nr:cytochrome c [Pseudomonadota bacterium]
MLLTLVAPQLWATNQASTEKSDTRWAKVSVVLPTSATSFPAGDGADIANSQCLVCHSAGMVLRQPALSESQWQTIINKMRIAYGAPLQADQVNALAAYLSKTISEHGAADSSTTTK